MPTPGPGAPCVLIVDDDRDVRITLAAIVASRGYAVAMAEHGEAALDYLAVNPPPAVVLLDLRMPVMDGWSLRDALASDPKTASIPIIVMSEVSGNGALDARLASLPRLPKPIGLEALLDVIGAVCRR